MAPLKTEGEIRAEAAQADIFVQQQNFVAALPLYEDLHTQRPDDLQFQERLALSLVGMAKQQPPAEAAATRNRARMLLQKGQAAGNNSNMTQVLLESLGTSEPPPAPPQPGQDLVDQGEKAFTHGDLPGAVEAYKRALDVNPKLYVAALFAGDAEFKQDHFAEAGAWFTKAIAIDPNVETAYRYWGDTLDKAGNHKHAEEEFIAGIVAQPYLRASRVGLQQWATRNHAQVVPPPITLPAEASVDPKSNGKGINITVPPDVANKQTPELSLDLAYSMTTGLWHTERFHKHFPDEPAYRHSLAEVVDSVRTMLTVAKELHVPDDQLGTSVRLLRELDNKGMLECWVLLDRPDAGIAHDYGAYRDTHRALLEQYIANYDVHPL